MEKENLGKKVVYGIIVIVIILVIGMIIIKVSKSSANDNSEMKNITNVVVNEIDEDIPEENQTVKGPEDTMRAGVRE